MVALWYLLALAPFIVIPVLWLNYRRKQADRERAANERWQQMLGKATTAERLPERVVASDIPPAVPRAQQAPYQRRPRLLDASQTLMFYLLRSGLPECEIFVRVGVDRLLSLPVDVADGREARLRTLAQLVVDFVVCDKAMQPIAAVDLLEEEATAALTTAPDFKTLCFAHSEIRYVRIPRNAMPKRHEVRALVLGPQAVSAKR